MDNKTLNELRNLSALMASKKCSYRKLSKPCVFRTWSNTGLTIVDSKKGIVYKLNSVEQAAALLCDATVDITLPVIPPSILKALNHLMDIGLIEQCTSEATLAEYQKNITFDNNCVSTVMWVITGNCNYRCKHCFLSATGYTKQDLDFEQCKKIIDQMASCGVVKVNISGGEPLVHKHFMDIVRYLNDKGIVVGSIGTNGALLTEKMLDEFDAIGIKPDIFMSYDGNGMHEWLRGIPGAEKLLLEKHKMLHNRGFKSGSAMSLHKNNKELLRESINTLADAGCEAVIVNRIFDFGAWKNNGYELELSPTEYADVLLEYIPHYFKDGMPVSLQYKPLFVSHQNIKSLLVSLKRNCYEPDKCNVCNVTYENAVITEEGRLIPCYMMVGMPIAEKFPLILDKGFKNCITNSEYVRHSHLKVSDYLDSNPECKNCKYLSKCAAGCRAFALLEHPNNYLAKDMITCKLLHAEYDKKIYECIKKYCLDADFIE